MSEQAENDGGTPLGGSGGELSTREARWIRQLSRRRDWDISPAAFERLPKQMEEMACDPKRSDRARTTAANVLLTMNAQNANNERQNIVTAYRVSPPEPPQTPNDFDPRQTAFLEQPTMDDLRSTCKVLLELGIIERMATVGAIDVKSEPTNGNGR